MSDAAAHDVFEDEGSWGRFREVYAPRNVALGVAVPAAITAVATAAAAASRQGVRPGLGVAWAFVLLIAPLSAWSARRVAARDARGFVRSYVVGSVAQYLWLQFTCWYSPPWVSVLGVMVFCAWAFNDALYFYNRPLLRAQNILAFPAFDLALLVVDLLGGDGILRLHATSPGAVTTLLLGQATVALVAQVVVSAVGGREYARKLADDQRARDHDRAVSRAERDALRNVSVYLAHGLAASKFAHDVMSPITAAGLDLESLRDELDRAPGTPSPERDAWRRDADAVLDDVAASFERVRAMADALARAVKNVEAVAPVPARELVARAVEAMHATLRGHGVSTPAPAIDVDDLPVVVADGHASTLANLLTNGALQRPDAPLDLRGRAHDERYYVLTLRDHGVAPDARDEALAAIGRALTLDTAAARAQEAPGDRRYRGYGIALAMARVFVMRYRGALGVSAPAAGRGVVMHLVLPRVAWDALPDDAAADDVLAASVAARHG